jgi:hypothetical protein
MPRYFYRSMSRLEKTGFWPTAGAVLGLGLLLGGAVLYLQPAWNTMRFSHGVNRQVTTTREIPDQAPRTGRPPLAANNDSLRALFWHQLRAEHLLPRTDTVAWLLTSQEFWLNGRLQPAPVQARYRQLYEAATGALMLPDARYEVRSTASYRRGRQPRIGQGQADTTLAALRRQLLGSWR